MENPNPTDPNLGQVQKINIDHQMRSAYLDYAMSVIVARALPDARDGMKPVQRRILYAMHDMGLRANTSYKKSARIVGEVLGKYHPHGDSAVYDAMARMAQDFSMRYLLVDGQGNFGSVDGDAPAAMRYTEARLSRMAEEILADIEKNTVNFGDNFDGSLQEPLVLPARLPNLLLNGATGIAVGMATNIPPHNLREVAAAINYLIDRYDEVDEVGVEELMQFVKGPDFPTGGIIVGREGINAAYGEGKGRIVVRGVAHIEDMSGNRQRIVITELPYMVNKSTLIERIAELVRDDRIDAISDLRDESDRRGISVVIELKRGAQARKVLNQLYKYTALQSTFGVQMLALVRGEPKLLRLKPALQAFVEHRREVITRRSQFELDKARHRAHILEGLLIALANLDDVINTIRQSPDAETARTRLIERFKLTEIQAQAILDMQLRRLAALERQKIEDEYTEVQAQIAKLEDLLNSPKKILALIQTDLNEMAEKYGDDRRTQIAAEATEEMSEEDLVENKPVLISLTQRGYIKRTPQEKYRAQSRGGMGARGQELREEDVVQYIFLARTLDTILFFSDKGKVYSEKAYQIPEADRADRGMALANVINIPPGENITAIVPVRDFGDADFCTMVTRNGRIKRIALSEFAQVRPSGIIATNLDDGDIWGWVRLTSGNNEVIFITEVGQALRYEEPEVRAMGRTAAGVTAIRLDDGDFVTSMEVVEPDGELLVVTANGYGKRTAFEEYTAKGRATMGVATIAQKSVETTGRIVSARAVREEDDITVITTNGQTLRLKVAEVRQSGRSTMGTRLINIKEGDSVASVARLAAKDLVVAAAEEKPSAKKEPVVQEAKEPVEVSVNGVAE
ncbi:MAG: DNA gyrase subunit A [Anaerolineales bacterium]|nr:DNA gyrase subunit A [Anaerolineales bacterium]